MKLALPSADANELGEEVTEEEDDDDDYEEEEEGDR